MILMLYLIGHVPTYSTSSCVIPPHHHSVSQVVYLEGSGGLELHIESLTNPFDISNGEIIDVDAVFRDKIDPSTYNLYIGCGGCDIINDKIENITIPSSIIEYQEGTLEQFTQTWYRSVFPKSKRKYNTSLLENCSHFTIRLHDFGNRSDSSSIIWGAVIGLDESFTILELLSFPVYILRNHGENWNQLGYTYGIWLFIGSPVILFTIICILNISFSIFPLTLRKGIYVLGLLGFTSAYFEELTHLIYAQAQIPFTSKFWIGFIIIDVSQFIGILSIIWLWYYSHPQNRIFACIQIIFGFLLFFFFGSGFYLGPSSIILAGILHFFKKRNPTQEISFSNKTSVGSTHMSRPNTKSFQKSNLGFIHNI
jgi:hypothetical protein